VQRYSIYSERVGNNVKKSGFHLFTSIVADIAIIIGLNLMVLLIIDVFFNQAMNFLGNNFFKYSSMLSIACGIYLAVNYLWNSKKNDD